MVYNKKEFRRMANMRPPIYCKPCDSRTHNESECWGECENCSQRNHQSKHCRYKKVQQQQQTNPQPERADKAATKGKKKRNRRAGKKRHSTIVIQGEKVKKKKKHLERNRLGKQILMKTESKIRKINLRTSNI